MSLFESISGLLGAGASVVGNILGTSTGKYRQYKYQSKLQEQAAQLNYDYGQKALQNNALSTRQGLEKAGYNPMLAVQNATSGANAGWTTTGQSADADYGASISSGISNAQSFQRLENETQQTESNIEANEATARNQNAEAANKEAQNPYISKQNEAQLGKLNAETANLSHQNDLIDAQIENMQKRIELDKYLGQLGYNAQIYGHNKAYNASTYVADKNNQYKTLSQYAGKWVEDKLHSLSGSRFGRDLAKLGRKFYKN